MVHSSPVKLSQTLSFQRNGRWRSQIIGSAIAMCIFVVAYAQQFMGSSTLNRLYSIWCNLPKVGQGVESVAMVTPVAALRS